MFLSGSFFLYDVVAHQRAMNVHPDDDCHDIALTKTGSADQEQWGLLVCSNDMAYPGEPA